MPPRTIRLRLTILYGVVSVLSAAVLLAITIMLAGGLTPRTTPVPGQAATTSGQQALAQALARIAQLQAQLRQVDPLHQLLVAAAAALAIMAGTSIALGWVVAGRALRPLRAITTATQQISEEDLHRRLAMPGPRDELTNLADTIDGLLARLQAAFEGQQNFVANASHELRTPLAASRTMLEVALADPAASAAALRSACQDVLTEERHQERLIDALLTLARSQRGLDRRQPRRDRQRLDRLGSRPRRRRPAPPACRQPDRQRAAPQRPPRHAQHSRHVRPRSLDAQGRQHRARHSPRRDRAAPPAVPAPVLPAARRR